MMPDVVPDIEQRSAGLWRQILALAWSPHRIPEIAARIGVWRCLIVQTICIGCVVVAPLTVISSHTDVPFASASEYWKSVLSVSAIVLLTVFSSLVVFVALSLMALHVQAAKPDLKFQRLWAIFTLSLVPLTIPGLIWSAAYLTASIPENVSAPTPDWMTSPLLRIAGSCFWPPLGLAIWGVAAVRSLRRLDWPHVGRCGDCGYSVVGLGTGRCPECGAPISAVADAPEARTVKPDAATKDAEKQEGTKGEQGWSSPS